MKKTISKKIQTKQEKCEPEKRCESKKINNVNFG